MLIGDLVRHIKREEKYDHPTDHEGGVGAVFFVNEEMLDKKLAKLANVAMERHGNIPVIFPAEPEVEVVEVEKVVEQVNPADAEMEAKIVEMEGTIKELKKALKAAEKAAEKPAPAKKKGK